MLRLIAVAALILLMDCRNSTSYGGSPPPPPPPPPPPAGGHLTTITVGNNFFTPTPDTIPAGGVTFAWNTPSNGHSVTWDSGPGTLPTSSTVKTTGTYQATLQIGTYMYHCSVHASMQGQIVVQ